MIADEATLRRLMALSQKGDRGAYRVLLSEASGWLERYFRHKVPSAQTGDLVQEVLLALHHKRATFDPSRPFLPWLAAIARYRWVDHLRKVYRRQEEALEDYDAASDSGEEAMMARISLGRLLQQIPAKQALAIELVKIEGHSIRDAATHCGQSEAAIKVNIHRGLKRLSGLIEKAD